MADPAVLIQPLREMPEAGRLLAGAFKDVTNTARGLFEKLGWNRVEEIPYHGEEVTLYQTSRRTKRH